MDEITNTNTINAITEYKNIHSNLSVKAFVHTTKASIYHPKFSWFKTREGGVSCNWIRKSNAKRFKKE